jgi:hypothetical protein
MLSVQQDAMVALDSQWTTMPPLRLGKVPSGLGTADLFVTISDDYTRHFFHNWPPPNRAD